MIPIVMVWGLVSAGQHNVAGWVIGLVGLIGTNLIRLVAEKFEHAPITTPVDPGTGNVAMDDV